MKPRIIRFKKGSRTQFRQGMRQVSRLAVGTGKLLMGFNQCRG